MELNHNTPFLGVWVKNEFLFNQTKGHGELTEAILFGVTSIRQRALMFNILTVTGAHWRNIPPHALVHTDRLPQNSRSLSELQLWNCYSNNVTVIEWEYFRNHRCKVRIGKEIVEGTYQFTVDWLPEHHIDTTFTLEPAQSKCGHVIFLDDGHVAVMPTNRVLWTDTYFVGQDPQAHKQGYLTNEHTWIAESPIEDFSKDERQFYGKDEVSEL